MKNKKKAEEIAVERFQLLAPLVAEGADTAKVRKLRAEIATQAGLSERTLRRYMAKFQDGGFAALTPLGKGVTEKDDAVPSEVLSQAIQLRREVPGRSVSQIIQLLEWEGHITAGSIKRSTLQEKLSDKGYSSRQMRLYSDSGTAARRFQKKNRNQLWHSDIKYGPYLPIGPGGKKQQVYLVTFIDDATRFVLHGAFYPTLDQRIVEDAFRRAVQKYGAPKAVYFDNGKQYRTKWMTRTCSKLGTRLVFARPYSPEATGKVERFNRVVDGFLAEAQLEKPKTLQALNDLFDVWLSECYQHKSHSALHEQKSPSCIYQSDSSPLRFIDPDALRDAFLHCEERRVDKAGCISFMNKKYEAGLAFIGTTVSVIYDPQDIGELTLEYAGHKPWQVKELVITGRAGVRPKLPERLMKAPAAGSRVLMGAKNQSEKRDEIILPAVSYRTIRKEDVGHV